MAATYEPIATTTLGSAASSITFSSISNTYTDLRVVLNCKLDQDTNLYARLNSDSGTNYSFTRLTGNGTAASSGRGSGRSQIDLAIVGSTGSDFTFVDLNIFSYAGSTYKTCLSVYSGDKNGSGVTESVVSLWRNTAAVTTITLLPSSGSANFSIGTTATIWGIKAA